ncbi:hypothetical protein CEUSTIGMA_g3079.t1 [Chlamydomonas eustigma]|uniref:SPX domain-containing protein n=1 Tax=Chlamydomonas eustigma TaxID=1157962 RepID=A0A250WXX4_9CHLO|nr:hypothetical protein CEUSTIGMA_g3079.t1 [Chlamydomonas eustigma]|eukprot:GAX75635.1 hypothetical protein CEUSTIGMA_g3079.t1 [Chlamydomonas eustigma]
MKFCKVLENQAKDMPELNDMFLRYKQLKKKIKAIPLPKEITSGANEETTSKEESVSGQLSPEEREFMAALNEDLARFNNFFIDKEEDAVIKLQDMSDQLMSQQATREHLLQIKQRLVDFHGELVMTLHWSLINYSAIVKILKKHDKRSGVLLRAPYLANVLQQPFSSTNVMSRLVKRAEELVEKAAILTGSVKNDAAVVLPPPEPAVGEVQPGPSSDLLLHPAVISATSGALERCGSIEDESTSVSAPISAQQQKPLAQMARQTERALEMWESLAKTASTPSTILNSQSGDGGVTIAGGPPGNDDFARNSCNSTAAAKRKSDVMELSAGQEAKKVAMV